MRRGLAGLLCGLWLSPTTRAQAEETTELRQRQLLSHYVDSALSRQIAGEVAGVADIGLATAGLALAFRERHEEKRLATTWLIGFGAIDLAALQSLLLTRDARDVVLDTAVFAVPAVLNLGLTLADEPRPFSRLTTATLTASYTAAGLLSAINDAFTPTSYGRLRAHQKRLGQLERPLSLAERRSMHRDMLGARGPLPRVAVGAPLMLGGLIAAWPAFDRGNERSERIGAAIFGWLSFGGGLVYLFDGPAQRYEHDVKSLQLSVAATPGGLALRGSFTAW